MHFLVGRGQAGNIYDSGWILRTHGLDLDFTIRSLSWILYHVRCMPIRSQIDRHQLGTCHHPCVMFRRVHGLVRQPHGQRVVKLVFIVRSLIGTGVARSGGVMAIVHNAELMHDMRCVLSSMRMRGAVIVRMHDMR